MHVTQVIKRPVLTEKSNNLQAQNTYTFEVDYAANKYQIKQAVEFIFQVKVVKVNTIKIDKKFKRLGRFEGYLNRYKKAIVTLKEGDVINFYPNEAEVQDEAKKAEKAQKAQAEKAESQEKEAKLAEKLAAKKAQAKTKKPATKKTKAEE